MRILNLYPGGYAANCYLVTQGDAAVLVDCTASTEAVKAALHDTGTALCAILLTHAHFDHMLTLDTVRAATNAPIYLMSGDEDLPGDGQKNAHAIFFGTSRTYPTPDQLLQAGDVLTFGELSFRAMSTPGHTRGSALYVIDHAAFTGDTLFANGFGRYDLYGGDAVALSHSLASIAKLPPDTVIYPGHGEAAPLFTALDAIKGFI